MAPEAGGDINLGDRPSPRNAVDDGEAEKMVEAGLKIGSTFPILYRCLKLKLSSDDGLRFGMGFCLN
jgi:hypothetical protein